MGEQAEFVVATDASDIGLGAVLMQHNDEGVLQPVSYFAKKLNGAQQRYSAYDKEALGTVEAIEHWRTYFDG